MKNKKPIALPLFILVGGPKHVPLMLEQSGLRYATLFTSKASVSHFQRACCSQDSYQLQSLNTVGELQTVLLMMRKSACSLILIDPLEQDVEQGQVQLLAVMLRQLERAPAAKAQKQK